MPILGLDHAQLAMPRGREDEARRFYSAVLGLTEIEKPPNLAKRGGVWFALGNQQLHLGVGDEFRPARKAHPAILVQGIKDLREILTSHGLVPMDDESLPVFAGSTSPIRSAIVSSFLSACPTDPLPPG